MKIEKVETLRVDKFLYVHITTDTGIRGLGEAGMWGYVGACESVIKQWTPYLLEAVIGLGPNLFYGTGLAACILIFRQRKAPDRKNTVLILDASKEFKTGRAQNELRPEYVERIHGWYHAYQDVAGVARVVTLEEIAANDYNLNIPRYVEPKTQQEVLTVDEAMMRLRKSIKMAFDAEAQLAEILKREGVLIDK